MASGMYHNSVKPVQRSKGRSAVAAAAYRSGEQITDQRTGIEHDYTRKGDVVATMLIGWNGTRAELWNAAEAETRTNACTAREYEVGLPVDLPPAQQRELARAYGEWLHNEYGVAVDVCIHNKPGNPHAHIMTTTRATTGTELTDKVWREWSPQRRKAAGLEPRHTDIERARAVYAELANNALRAAGADTRLDHRSYKRQGLELVPTQHMGPAATAMERRGERTEIGNYNRTVHALNAATAEVIDLQAERDRRAAAAAEQRLQVALSKERSKCAGMTPDELRDRAAMWRGRATDTPEIVEQQRALAALQNRFGDGWAMPGTAEHDLAAAQRRLDRLEAGTGLHRKLLPFAVPDELRDARAEVKRLTAEVAELPAAIEDADQKLDHLRRARQAQWLTNGHTREALAALCADELAPAAEARQQAETERAEALAEREERQRQERIARYGYDTHAETRDEYLRRQAAEQQQRQQAEAEARRKQAETEREARQAGKQSKRQSKGMGM